MGKANKMHPDILKILVTKEDIQQTVSTLAKRISEDYKALRAPGEDLVAVGILKGSVVFYADLVRALETDVRFDFLEVSSYGRSTASSGVVKINKDLAADIGGAHVLLIEDIVDSGHTLTYLLDFLQKRSPRTLRVCTLLDKPSRRKVNFTPHYVGVEIPDEFAVGYGLDYAEHYRNLPYVGVLKPEIYKQEQ